MEHYAVDGYSRGSQDKIQHMINEAKKYKEEGNKKYQAGEIRSAIRLYHKSLLYLKGITQGQESVGSVLGMSNQTQLPADIQAALIKLRSDCHNNLAASLMQKASPDYERVVSLCDRVTENQPTNHKAHFRKGQALYELRDYDNALKSFLLAKQHMASANSQVTKYIDLCHKALQKQHDIMKDTYKNMFSRASEAHPQKTT